MDNNVFNEKKDYLLEALRDVQEKNMMAEALDKKKAERKKLTKSIASEEKSIADEISSTIKKRKQEINNTYDGRLDDNRDRKRKVTIKRDKKKAQRVSERVKAETRHLREDSEDLQIEMKTLLRRNKMPSFCRSRFYHALFHPHGADELLVMLISLVAGFAGIPALMMLIFKKLVFEKKTGINMAAWCVGVFAITLILMLVIYFLILNKTRFAHADIIAQTRSITDKIKANEKQAKAIKNAIEKDKDESSYHLDAFDEKLDKLDAEADGISREKQEVLRTFEDETKHIITQEIEGRRLPKLEDMKEQLHVLEEEIGAGEDAYSEKVISISNQYASFLGEDMCREDRLKDLINLMEEDQAETVSEAIAIYKGR